MLKHFFRLTLKTLLKNKVFTVINFLGLATGMTAFILIMVFVRFELSYDTFHERGDRVYRLRSEIFKNNEIVQDIAQTYPKVGPVLKDDYQEVEDFCRLFPVNGGALINVEDNSYNESRIFFAESSFFKLFSYPILKADGDSLLSKPNMAVVTTSLATKYFGKEDPIGKVVTFHWFGNKVDFVVEGVVPDSPANTHLKFGMLFSYSTLRQLSGGESERSWGWNNFYTYLLLAPGSDPHQFQQKLPGFVDKYLKSDQKKDQFTLQPVRDIHLRSAVSDELEASGNENMVYLMIVVAIFILVIAWINYINLSIARSSERAKEVAIRKVNGAQRRALVAQFLFEAFFVNLLAVVFTLVLLAVSVSFYDDLTGIQLSLDIFKDPVLWATLAVVFIMGVATSGIYPAFVMSSFRPMNVLGGKLRVKRHVLRSAFVTFQYATAAFLIVCIVTVYRQVDFLKHKDLAFRKDHVLVVKGPKNANNGSYSSDYNKLRDFLHSQSMVESFASSSAVPGIPLAGIMQYIRPVNTPEKDANTFFSVGVDQSFFDTYGIALVAGKNFTGNDSIDVNHIIFNEEGVKLLGFKSAEDAIDKKIIGPEKNEVEIVGVVKNFHQLSPRNGFYPTYFTFRKMPNPQIFYSVRFQAGNAEQLIASLESKWNTFFPGSAFEYFYLEDFFNLQYKDDVQFSKILVFFTVIAIIITCLGFFALVSFNTTLKSREIGVRKVFGASSGSIVYLFFKEFLKLIVIANIVAWPLAFYYLKGWLNNFAFKTSVDVLPFALSLLLLALISFVTVGANILKAARGNLVESLRHE